MAQAKLVQKKVEMNQTDIIKYQLITHCFVHDVQLSNNELDCLTLLGSKNGYVLSDFCNLAVEAKIFKTPQTVRNFLTKAQKKGLVEKTKDDARKSIRLIPKLNIQTEGSIVLDFKMYYIATKEQ
jgi:DNA-binding MarR family transcriptional regulator